MDLKNVLVELQLKRNQIAEFQSQFTEMIRKKITHEKRIQELEKELSDVKNQLRISMSSFDLQAETRAQIQAAPNVTNFMLMKAENKLLQEKFENLKNYFKEVTQERDGFRMENESVKRQNQQLHSENTAIMDIVESLKIAIKKLENEQETVKRIISNSNNRIQNLNQKLTEYHEKIKNLETENQKHLEEKAKYLSHKLPDPPIARLLEDNTQFRELKAVIDRLKSEIIIERQEKSKLAEKLLESTLTIQKLVKDFEVELNTD